VNFLFFSNEEVTASGFEDFMQHSFGPETEDKKTSKATACRIMESSILVY
jgi:hypothetical protein